MLKRDSILKKAETLLNTLPKAECLRERVYVAYHQSILSQLRAILNTPQTEEACIEALRGLLKTNWALVKGTLLSHTVIPESDITRLLVEVAEGIAANDNNKITSSKEKPTGVIQLLIPGVCTDSMREKQSSRPLGVVVQATAHEQQRGFRARKQCGRWRLLGHHCL